MSIFISIHDGSTDAMFQQQPRVGVCGKVHLRLFKYVPGARRSFDVDIVELSTSGPRS